MPKFAIPITKSMAQPIAEMFNGGVQPADEMITEDARFWFVFDPDPDVPNEIVDFWSLPGQLGRVDFVEVHTIKED